ncbi:hypothetical protein [Siccibacter turicensis]|uniref:hypothetical protein n=1 Tax=Siccibacter turicensis TaxID=357233 RepID=UPI00101F3C47|nr:hypothetical protein [Siccibacter turicensis]
MTKVSIGLSVALSALAMSAAAQTCDPTQRAMNANNLQIIAELSAPKGEMASYHAVAKGENIDFTTDTRATFTPCNVLESASTTYSRDDGISKMTMDYHLKRDAEGWITTEAMTITAKEKTLTDMKGETRYRPDSTGRITESIATFTLDGQLAQTRTQYEYDKNNRIVRTVARSSLPFFEETTELSYDTRGLLIRTSSGKTNSTVSWGEDGRWLRSETETSHPYSVLYTVDECTKWDKQGSCLKVKREEKEKYAKQTTRYTFVMNKEIRYY